MREGCPGAHYARRNCELRFAIAMEKFSKDEILQRYLNIAYYGQGAYGVEAAARHYFSTKASKLTLFQAAMLAGLVQNPDSNNPVRNPSAALDRRDVVINRMVELKLITLDQAKEAKQTGFDQKKVKKTWNGCVGTRYPFLCDYVRRTLLNTPSLGKTEDDRENMINHGGLVIQTAIDPKTQDLAEKVSPEWSARGPGHLDHEHDPARYRVDHRDGTKQTRDGQQCQERPDLLEPGRGSGHGRHPGLSGRLDLQAVHTRRCLGEGHPDQQEVQCQVTPQLHRSAVHIVPWTRAFGTAGS